MARLTRLTGSRKPREVLLKRWSISLVSHGLQKSKELTRRGNRSGAGEVSFLSIMRAERYQRLTVDEDDGLVGFGIDMPRLVGADSAVGSSALASPRWLAQAQAQGGCCRGAVPESAGCRSQRQRPCHPRPGRCPKQDPSWYHCFMADFNVYSTEFIVLRPGTEYSVQVVGLQMDAARMCSRPASSPLPTDAKQFPLPHHPRANQCWPGRCARDCYRLVLQTLTTTGNRTLDAPARPGHHPPAGHQPAPHFPSPPQAISGRGY